MALELRSPHSLLSCTKCLENFRATAAMQWGRYMGLLGAWQQLHPMFVQRIERRSRWGKCGSPGDANDYFKRLIL